MIDQGAFSLVTNRQNQILLVQLPKDFKEFPKAWNLPGGLVKATEKPADGAVREVLNLHIVQGEFDRFGNAEVVRSELQKAGVEAAVDEVKNATHSFRDKETDTQPIHEDKAIEKVDL